MANDCTCGWKNRTGKKNALQLHQANHCKLNKEDKGGNDDYKCPECGGVKFRILSAKVQHERAAIAEGYTEVCISCKELI